MDLKIYGLLGSIIFILLTIKKIDWFLSLEIAFSVSFIVYLCVYFKDTFGLKRHKAIIVTKLFRQLVENHFNPENHNNYYGLKGSYKNCVVRIYYDWNKQAESTFSFGDLVINVYYEPIYNSALKEPEMEKLEELNSAYSFGIRWVRKKRNYSLFSTGYFIRQMNYTASLTIEKVFNEIDFCINEISKNGLTLISIETLDKYEKKYGELYLPFIDTYRQID